MSEDRYEFNPQYPKQRWDKIKRTWVDWPLKHARKPNGNGEPFLNGETAVNQDEEAISMCAKDIKTERIDWLWKYWLAKGKIHIVAGVPEAGKTTIALSFAASVSSGGMWPDGTHAPQGNVLMWTSEDDLADTLVPRLMRMGADLSRIHFIRQTKGKDGKPRPFNPALDIPLLVKKAKAIGDVAMFSIDPLVSVMPGNRDSHKAAETRNSLQPLLDFTEAADCVTIGIAHLTKGTAGKDPLERINGSGAFGAVPRVVLFAAKNDADEPERIMVRVKSNIGPSGGGFGYHIDAAPLIEQPDIEATRIVWEEALEGDPRELLGDAEAQGDGGGHHTSAKDAVAFLASALSRGERLQTDLAAEAAVLGISESRLHRASTKLDIVKKPGAVRGKWLWKLS